MTHPSPNLPEALEALNRIGPLLVPDLYRVGVVPALWGWHVALRGPEGRSMAALAGRLGLHHQPEADREEGRQRLSDYAGRSGRVLVLLTTESHAVTRVGGRGYPAGARRAES